MRPENLFENQAVIKVFGVGGAGSNAINRMISEGVQGIEFVAMNTDSQALFASRATKTIQLGSESTRGLGAGGDPETGERAARESEGIIREELKDVDMVFITAGMGGGTGTGAAPVIADIAKKMGILTVGVVTKPFGFEGPKRKRLANSGAERLRSVVDTLITVPNDRLLEYVGKKATVQQAFAAADDILRQGVQGISDIILLPGMINVDFADVRSVMSNAGVALMGLGRGVGEQRAKLAAQAAANSPLLETNIQGAKKLLVNITAGEDFSIGEAYEAMEYLMTFTDAENAEIIMGHVLRQTEDNEVQITLLAAGMDSQNETVASRAEKSFYLAPEADQSQRPATARPIETTLPKEIFAQPNFELDEVIEKPISVQPITSVVSSDVSATDPQISFAEPARSTAQATVTEFEDLDIDIPAFLRRQRLGQ